MTELTSTSTSTQFERLRTVMDPPDIEPGTVVAVGAWEAMRVIDNDSRNEKAWAGFDGCTYTHEEFANTIRSTHDVVRVVHYGII